MLAQQAAVLEMEVQARRSSRGSQAGRSLVLFICGAAPTSLLDFPKNSTKPFFGECIGKRVSRVLSLNCLDV